MDEVLMFRTSSPRCACSLTLVGMYDRFPECSSGGLQGGGAYRELRVVFDVSTYNTHF